MPISISQYKNSQIHNLISGNIPVIEIPDVLSKSECFLLCNEISKNHSTTSSPGPVSYTHLTLPPIYSV